MELVLIFQLGESKKIPYLFTGQGYYFNDTCIENQVIIMII